MKPLSQLLADFRKDNAAVKEVIAKLPRIIGNASLKAIDTNFKMQGYFDGKRTSPWKERKPSTNKSYDARGKAYKGRVFNSANPILIQTNKLRDSIKYQARAKSVFVYTSLKIVPYAQAHNEGNGKMPQRQFMPLPNSDGNSYIYQITKDKFNTMVQTALKDLKV